MKFQLVVMVLLVGCMLELSQAAPLREEGEARAVLQAIRMLLAAENQDHSELQQAENATSVPSNQPSNATSNGPWARGECQIEENDRTECGYYGITQPLCKDKGCCWKAPDVPGVPFCFNRIDTHPKCITDDKVQCGNPDISDEDCEWRGCCYSPTTASGQSWCYHGKATEPQCQTAPASRVECGHLGITGAQCRGSGCCWSPTSVSGAPWCFTKSSAPNEAARFAYFGNKQNQSS